MKEVDIIIRALKAEAMVKPDEKIFVGRESFTYAEFAGMLGTEKLQRNHRKFVENFLNSAKKMFKENPVYRQKMIQLAGVGT